MTKEQFTFFESRINSIEENDKPLFGKMNVKQMIAHCTDQIRMMFGEIKGLRRENVDMVKIREMIAKGESVSTVDGLDQIMGQGTKPADFENDKKQLIEYIKRFIATPDSYSFHFHPFIGDMDKQKWARLLVYHLEHHLKQFGR